MKRTIGLLVMGAVALSAAPAQAGVFDDTFGWAGIAPVQLSATTGDRFNAVANGPDGSVYAAGYVITSPANQAMAVARLDPSGRLDPTFGSGGFAVADQSPLAGTGEQARGVVVQSDGKVVIAGPAPRNAVGADPADSDIYVSRFTAGGQPDSTFGENGTRAIDLSPGADQSWGLMVLPNDKLVVVGARGADPAAGREDRDFAIVGLAPGGSLDSQFGEAGVRIVRATAVVGGTTYQLNENPRGGTVQSDGKILIGSYASGLAATPASTVTRPQIFRLLPDGRLDPDFGTGGIASFDRNGAAPNTSESYMLAQQADGKIVSVGYGNTATPSGVNVNLLVARLNTNGTPDTSFATGGVFSYDGGRADRARNVVVTPDDKILIAGNTEVGASSANALFLKLNSDGSRDTAFGVNGALVVDLGGSSDALFGLTLTPDRKRAVAAGWKGVSLDGDDGAAIRLGVEPPSTPAPQIVTVTNTVTVAAPVPPKPAAPLAKASIKNNARLKSGPRRLAGSVSSPANVSKVLVRLTRGTGSKCRAYVPSKGTFSGRSCTAGKAFAAAYADGRWTVDLPRKLTKASYTLAVIAYGLDGAAQPGTNRIKFSVTR